MEYKNGHDDSGHVLELTVNLARLILKNIKTIALFTIGVMIIAGVFVYLLPDEYTSTASILPTGQSDNLSALKQLAGLTAGNIDIGENSSALFPEILSSNQVRDAVADTEYTFSFDGEQHSFSFKKDYDTDNREILRDAVESITEISSDPQTGIIDISVTTEYPQLSQQILQKTISELERYNSEIRRSQAKESARYLDRELKDRQKELSASEQRLAEFQKANQNWYATTDPDILTDLSRLRRDIEINSQAYLLLREQYELARLNVQKDIPVVSLLDSPTLPSMKSGPRRKLIIFIVGIFAFIMIVAFIIIRDAYHNWVAKSDSGSLRELKGDIIRTFPLVNRIFLKRKGEYRESDSSVSHDSQK